MKRSWLFHISPCMLAAVFCLISIIAGFAENQRSGGLSMLAAIFLLPAFFILLLADFLIKAVTKGNVLYIWIIEAVVIAILLIGSKNAFF